MKQSKYYNIKGYSSYDGHCKDKYVGVARRVTTSHGSVQAEMRLVNFLKIIQTRKSSRSDRSIITYLVRT